MDNFTTGQIISHCEMEYVYEISSLSGTYIYVSDNEKAKFIANSLIESGDVDVKLRCLGLFPFGGEDE